MQERDFYHQLTNKWPGLHWVRIENNAASGTPDVNVNIDGRDVWIETKMLHGNSIYMEKFQIQFHIRRNKQKGLVLLFARDRNRIMVLRLADPTAVPFARTAGKFRVFDLQYLELIIQWTKPFNWNEMFVDLKDKIKCL